MKYVIQNEIVYQREILERTENSFILPHQWNDDQLLYINPEKNSIYEFLEKQRDMEEMILLLKGCQKLMDMTNEMFLDLDKWVWDIKQCYWNGDIIQAQYIPDRQFQSSPLGIYQQITQRALMNMLSNGWYEENSILWLHRVHRASIREDWDTLSREIQISIERENSQPILESVVPPELITADEDLFQQWESNEAEEQMGKRKRRRKLSLPFR